MSSNHLCKGRAAPALWSSFVAFALLLTKRLCYIAKIPVIVGLRHRKLPLRFGILVLVGIESPLATAIGIRSPLWRGQTAANNGFGLNEWTCLDFSQGGNP